MEAEFPECDLLRKQLKKEEGVLLAKSHGAGREGDVMSDGSKLRYFD